MFAWKKIISKRCDQANSAPPEKVTYSLEAIMALQKSLERGLDNHIPHSEAGHDPGMSDPKAQSGLISRCTGPIKRFLRRPFLPRISGVSGDRKDLAEKTRRTAQPLS